MSLYEILPALDLTQSVHAKISIGIHRGVKFKISRITLIIIGLETRLGWRTDRKFLQNPNLNEITTTSKEINILGGIHQKYRTLPRTSKPCTPILSISNSILLYKEKLQWLSETVKPYKLFRPYDRFGRSWFSLSWCGLTQIRPYIKLMFRPYHIFMWPTANPALYQMEKNN
jgi:hypothetical protein